MQGIKRNCIVAAFLFRDGITEGAAQALSTLCTPLNPAYFDVLQPQWAIVVFLDTQQNRAVVADIIRQFESKTLGLPEDTALGVRCGEVLLGIEGELIVSATRPVGYPMSEAMTRAQNTTDQRLCEGCEDIL